MNLVYIEPNTDLWFKSRIGRITSSEVGKLFKSGKSKDILFGQTALTYLNIKIAEILTQERKEITAKQLDYGLSEEDWARQHYSQLTNQIVTNGRFYIYNEIFGGTNDGEIEAKNGIIEIKSPFASENHIELCLLNSGIELKEYDFDYYAQCQANIFIKKANWCDFISWDDRVLNPEFKMKIIRVYPDEQFQKDLLYRLDGAAEIMTERIERIFKIHKQNLTYRIAS